MSYESAGKQDTGRIPTERLERLEIAWRNLNNDERRELIGDAKYLVNKRMKLYFFRVLLNLIIFALIFYITPGNVPLWLMLMGAYAMALATFFINLTIQRHIAVKYNRSPYLFRQLIHGRTGKDI